MTCCSYLGIKKSPWYFCPCSAVIRKASLVVSNITCPLEPFTTVKAAGGSPDEKGGISRK